MEDLASEARDSLDLLQPAAAPEELDSFDFCELIPVGW